MRSQNVALFVAFVVLHAALAGAAEQAVRPGLEQRMTFNVKGVECERCAQIMSDMLSETGLTALTDIQPNTNGPSQVTATCPGDCDLGEAAAIVNVAPTPHRGKVQPRLSMVVFADLNEQEAQLALESCRQIKGIDAANCTYDSETSELHIRLAGKEKVTPMQILKALEGTGVKVAFAKSATEETTE